MRGPKKTFREPVRLEYIRLAEITKVGFSDYERSLLAIPYCEVAWSGEYLWPVGSIGQRQDVGVLNRNANDSAATLDSIDVIDFLKIERQNLLSMLYQYAQPASSGEGDSIFIEPGTADLLH